MWIFTKYCFFSAVCARQGDGEPGLPVDPNRLMIRGRVRGHLEALMERFPKLLGDRDIQAFTGTDYAYRFFVSKSDWAQVLAGLAEETDYDNFKSEVARHQGRPGAAYEHALHDVWSVMHRLQKLTISSEKGKNGGTLVLDYSEELRRRIGQFAGYLKKMHHRAHEEVHGSCFMIFEERPPSSTSGGKSLSEAAKPALELVLAGFDEAGILSVTRTEDVSFLGLPDGGWKEDDSQNRFIQFSFEEKWFCVDMPLQTLFRAEAEQILRSRKGFFYLRERPQFTLKGEDVDGYDPFRKVYLYGDEDSAAEDMAFIFFQVWRFPVDWRFFVKAAAFGKTSNWERGAHPIE